MRRVRLVLVRHGDAHAGFHGKIGGPLGCTGLTDLGHRQASALRDHLGSSDRVRADVLVSSTIPRAIETAEIIAPGLGIGTFDRDCDLCEVHTGEADGLDWAEWGARYGAFDMQAEPDRRFAPQGDSWSSFHERVHDVLARLAEEHEGRTVVAVCHAGVIVASVRLLLGVDQQVAGARLQPANTGLTEWQWDAAAGWTLHAFNEATHLLGTPG